MRGISRIAGMVLLAGAAAWGAGTMAGCDGQHPDRSNAVYKTLDQHHLVSVEVFQNQVNGVITLKGIVGNANNKAQAEQLVAQAAPGYTVNNQLTVDSTGLMSLANPHAKTLEVEQMAHPGAAEAAANNKAH